MKTRVTLLLSAFFVLVLSTILPLFLFFGQNREEPANQVVHTGELVSLGPSFRSSTGDAPKMGVKSAHLLEEGYAVDSYGNKYKVLAVEIAWNDAAVQSDFACEVSYHDERNRQKWRFRSSAYVVDFEGGIEIPETFVSPDEFSRPRKEDACGILKDQMGKRERRENGGLSSQAQQDPRRSITEFIPVPESVHIDHVVITARKRLGGGSSELMEQSDDFTIKAKIS